MTMGGALIGFTVVVLSLVRNHRHTTSDTSEWGDPSREKDIPFGITLGTLTFIGLPLSSFIWSRNLLSRCKSDLEDLCARYSARFPDVAFSFHDDANYDAVWNAEALMSQRRYRICIEPRVRGVAEMVAVDVDHRTRVNHSNDEVLVIPTAPVEGLVPSAPLEIEQNYPVATCVEMEESTLTVRKRLERLEELRGILSEEEYRTTRKDILESL